MRPMFTLFLCLLLCHSIQAQRHYVDQNAEGGNADGSSWENAFADLQTALAAAEDGDTIWVAAGTYYPTTGTDRVISFELKDGVAMYGGFSGLEATVEERIPGAYQTILSGDIGTPGDPTDNTYQVIRSFANSATTLVDGFTIRDGQATFSSNANETLNKGGGLYLAVNNAHLTGLPQFVNCHFQNNRAVNGGAIYCQAEGPMQVASPILINCRFTNNRANIFGGAIYKKGFHGPSGFTVEGCSFEGNRAFVGGGAISVASPSGTMNFVGNNFRENICQGEGGAIHLDIFAGNGNLHFEDCLFLDNVAQVGGGFYYAYFGFSPMENFDFEFVDCQFENNLSEVTGGGAIMLQNFYNHTALKLYRTSFRENRQNDTQSPGDAIHFALADGGSGMVDIQNCEFINNGIDKSAYGGLYINIGEQASFSPQAEVMIANSLFAQNGGALGLINGTGSLNTTIQNCTFHSNGSFPIQKTVDGEGSITNTVRISNSIIWESQTPPNHILNVLAAPVQNLNGFSIDHSIVSPQLCSMAENGEACGEGVLEGIYPVFVDTLGQNYHLAACSPALNIGLNSGLDTLAFTTDLSNNARIMEGQVDLGAFERETFNMNLLVMDTVTCPNNPSGAVNVFGNGTPPMLYQWDNGQTTGTYSHNLAAGHYTFTLTDALGCEDSAEVSIAGPSPLQWESETADPSMYNATDGFINFTVMEGGTPPFSYNWSNGATTASLSNIPAGEYQLTLTDGNDCEDQFTFVLNNPPNSTIEAGVGTIRLSPNPVGEGQVLRILLPQEGDSWEISAFNVHGQPVGKWALRQIGQEALMTIPDWPTGVYYLHLSNNLDQHFVRRILIH